MKFLKSIIVLFIVAQCILMSACTLIKKTEKFNPALNGTWVPTSQSLGDYQLPKSFYERQQLIIDNDKYTVYAENIDKGEMKFKGNKIKIHSTDGANKGKRFTAIYKLENDQLTICYNLSGKNFPTEFSSAKHPQYFLSVFKRK